MRKIILTIGFLLATVPAFSTEHFINNGSPDNTLPCTEIDPCDNFAGTTLDNTDALSPGDTVNFARGDEWVGAEAEVIIKSSGTEANPIYIQAYGTGANPVLAGAAVTSAGWSLHSGSIYLITGQSQTNLRVVTQDDNKALGRWTGTNSTLPEGSYKRESTTLYVHLWDDADPATSSVRIASYQHASGDNGRRGLLRGFDDTTHSNYLKFRDITVMASNGVAFSISGSYNRTAGLNIMGNGGDGWLCYHNEGFGGECTNYVSYYDEISYNAAEGAGNGQGWTSYGGPFGWIVGTVSHHNFMAGFDFLDFSANTNVTEVGCLRCTAYYNSLSPIDPSNDANLYIDGGSEVFVYGGVFYNGGGYLDNARSSTSSGTEHPTTNPINNNLWINNLIYGTKWVGFGPSELCDGNVTECPPDGFTEPNNIKNITMVNNTMAAISGAGFNMVLTVDNHSTVADNWIWRNNIMVGTAGKINSFMNAGTYLDADNNLYYIRGSSSSSTSIYEISGVNKSLAQWRTDSGEDANAAYGDPLFTVDADDSTMNALLQAGSPAIDTGYENPYTIPAWLPATVVADIGSCGVKGSALASGVEDSCSNMDMGYHKDYAGLTSVSIIPSSYVQSANGSITITFTMPEPVTALIYNWKVKLTLPSGFSWDSGGTSSVTASTISGTWTVSVASQSATFTRVGDGQSEFPGTYTITVSNVGNPSTPGTTGTFSLETQDENGTKIADDLDVTGITISSNSIANANFQSSKFLMKGFRIT